MGIKTNGSEEPEAKSGQYTEGYNKAQFQGFGLLNKKNNGPVWGMKMMFKVVYQNEAGQDLLTKKTFDLICSIYEKPLTTDLNIYNMLMKALGLAEVTAEQGTGDLPSVEELTPALLKPVMIKLDFSRDKEYLDFPKKWGLDKVMASDATAVTNAPAPAVTEGAQMKSWKDA